MELSDIADELDELGHGHEDRDDAFYLLVVKLGQTARHLMDIESTDVDELNPSEEAHLEHIYRDMCAGMLLATIDFMEEKDVDPDTAVQERLDMMRQHQQQAEMYQQIQEQQGEPEDDLDPEDDRTYR